MRIDQRTKLSEAEAISLLNDVVERAEKINVATRHHIPAVALRADTFVAVLKAQPKLIEWQKQIDLQHRPVYKSYVVVITRVAMESDAFRMGALQ